MNNASGVVKGVYSKDVTTRFGQKKTWDLLLDDGNYYKNGFKKPSVEAGDNVTIEYEVGKYGNEIKKLSTGLQGGSTASGGASPDANTGRPPQAGPSSQFNKYNKPFPVPSDHGDRSIIRQNSLTNARELIAMLQVHGEIDIGSGTLDEFVDKIIEVAYKFEEYSSGDREVKAVDAMVNATKAPKPKKAVKPTPEDGEPGA